MLRWQALNPDLFPPVDLNALTPATDIADWNQVKSAMRNAHVVRDQALTQLQNNIFLAKSLVGHYGVESDTLSVSAVLCIIHQVAESSSGDTIDFEGLIQSLSVTLPKDVSGAGLLLLSMYATISSSWLASLPWVSTQPISGKAISKALWTDIRQFNVRTANCPILESEVMALEAQTAKDQYPNYETLFKLMQIKIVGSGSFSCTWGQHSCGERQAHY